MLDGLRPIVLGLAVGAGYACSSGGDAGGDGQRPPEGGAGAAGAGGSAAAGGAAGSAGESGGGAGAGAGGSAGSGGAPADDLASNRGRLLESYLDFLTSTAAPPQSNGVSGTNVSSVCELWSRLDDSARGTFLTLTARMQGSRVGASGRSMLAHVTRLYRVVGGEGASGSDPGSCGGGEHNRMILSMDPALHTALLRAGEHQGAAQSGGGFDLGDVLPDTAWRDSRDLGGAHAPFDATNETNEGAPRGQTQYFRDPGSSLAASPLGRLDLATLVDPYALEIDQDYDCVHASNPLCTYVYYGPLCAPGPSALGSELYETKYGGLEPEWAPACG